MKKFLFALPLVACMMAGCSWGGGGSGEDAPEGTPSFTLSYSEYPSWSVYGVAHEKGLIDGRAGKQGPIEKKHGIDIVLREADYDACITLFGSGTVDASCQTNIDSIAPSLGRDSVIILPTSTSVGGDACVVVGLTEEQTKALQDKSKRDTTILDFLKDKTTYGLEKSVSQYVFERNVAQLGENQLKFKNMDPAAASQAMQTGQKNVESIMVWNPFVLQTLRTQPKATRLFDSSTIPEEVIDCVVIGKDSLNKEGGRKFAEALIDTYYQVCKMLDDPKTGDETYKALGAKFSNLSAKDMREVCQQTRFYNTPEKAAALMSSEKFQNQTMPMIVEFCLKHGMATKKPSVGFNDDKAQLNFDDSVLKSYNRGVKP